MRKLTGITTLDFDKDGDIGVRRGSAIAYVRLVEEGPSLHVFSPLVREIEVTLDVTEKLNELNAKGLGMRLFTLNETVFGVTDIPVVPFVDEVVMHAFDDFCRSADDLDNLLQGEFGGRTAFYEWVPSVAKH